MKNLQRRPNGGFGWKINAPALLKNLENIMDGLPGPAENHLQVTGFPVLFLKGEKSDYINDDDRINIIKLFPSAEIKTVKNAGHWIHTDNPDAIISALLSLHDD
jgi:pimeloyl-ACP methyl ester carboxylesterase